jgi:hypothetical protein
MDTIHHNTNYSIGGIILSNLLYLLSDLIPSIGTILQTMSLISVSMVIVINVRPFVKALGEHKKTIKHHIKKRKK